MGCLFEIFLQIFVEGTLGLFMFVYLKLAHILVPDKDTAYKIIAQLKSGANFDSLVEEHSM